MPLYFHFQDETREQSFHEALHCSRCTYVKQDGSRCKRSVCVGLPYCASHLPFALKLKIGTSTLPGAGKGLFAFDPTLPPDVRATHPIVFRKDTLVCLYSGEPNLTRDDLQSRYGDYTAPYGLQVRSTPEPRFEDAALERGVGSLINHQPARHCNCRLATHHGVARIMATKNIRHGDELFANYGRDYKFQEPTEYGTNRRRYSLG